ncbi:MAG TPA: hypothetical protein VJR26_14205 [Candidatus Acidoferrales bacterium]|nr:hypothetical protein [Candidatus Acidoferrales bacterium]
MNLRKVIAGVAAVLLLTPACLAFQDASRTSGTGAGAPTVTFRKVFKSSYPEFVEIKVSEAGTGTFDIRQLDESPNPQPLALGHQLAQRIFELAGLLHDFQGIQLEARRRIANLGQKTFRYDNSGETNEVTFNYTLNDSANQLLDIFEGISRQESDISDLRRTMRYDRLGVNDVLLQVQNDYKQKLLPEPEQLLSTLDAIANDDRIINIARDKARSLASHIRLAR